MRPKMKNEAPVVPEVSHVDDFIDDFRQDAYARWMLMHFRLPACQQSAFMPFIKDRKLFCTYNGKRYRCTGASRMGDVWLTTDFSREVGYDLRVVVSECKDWGPKE